MQDVFLSGVVEGFYGQTWSQTQRLDLFENLANWRLNTYFYSPKDDLKHRALWREPYTDSELSRMKTLIVECARRNINFVFGLSPGLDIRFSDSSELQSVKDRLSQMKSIGARHFALLFDDLPGNMTDQDRARFSSVASAQCSVTNQTFEWLRASDSECRLLFCPTPYCDRMVNWKLGGEDYLDTVGTELAAEIDVLWTGPEIISADISVESLANLTQRIRRKPIIWDNLHANDYDMRRLYTGPYSRNADMRNAVRGILSNPNNEYAINYIPLRTLGEYLNDEDYNPRRAYLNAAKDWAAHYATIHGQVSVEDVTFLADCYYLPYEEGDEAEQLKQAIYRIFSSDPSAWDGAFELLAASYKRTRQINEQLTELLDRDLFYAWSQRIWELREELELIHDFATHKKDGKPFISETHLPSTYRGGLVASLQRRMTMDDDGNFTSR